MIHLNQPCLASDLGKRALSLFNGVDYEQRSITIFEEAARLSMAVELYSKKNYGSAAATAEIVIRTSKLLEETIIDWLNPDEAIDNNDEGKWYRAWAEANQKIAPRFARSIAELLSAAVIYVDSAMKSDQSSAGFALGNRVLSFFSGVNYEQRKERVFKQLDFAILNGQLPKALLDNGHATFK